MTVLATPSSTVLRTDVYTLDCSVNSGLYPPLTGVGFFWMGMAGAEWLTVNHPYFYIAQYYSRWTYSVTVDTIRQITTGAGGMTVIDGQSVTSITMTISEIMTGNGGVYWYLTTDPQVDGPDLYPTADPAPGYYTQFPSSMSFTFDDASFNAATGLSTGIPQGTPVLFNAGGVVVATQSPAVSADPTTFLAEFEGVTVPVHKLTGCRAMGTVNGGTSIDPQTDAGALAVEEGGGSIIVLGPGTIGPGFSGYLYGGVANTTFGLLLDRPNVPLGTLSCKSTPQGSFPALPMLTATPNAVGALYSSAPCDTSNWGGFRYLTLSSRINGFSPTQPLPRVLLGIVPTAQLNAALCESALAGSPYAGIWYEVVAAEQGTAGQTVTVDLAKPIKGSGTWFDVDNGKFPLPDPLGVGAYSTNPVVPVPGTGTVTAGLPDNGAQLQTATLVLTVDGALCSLAGSKSATVDFSALALAETTGSVLSIACYALDNSPVAAGKQPTGIEVSTPLDGNLITITRDGKVALAIRTCPANADGSNPLAGVDYTFYGSTSGNFSWQELVSVLESFGNGYKWTFDPLYTNVPGITVGLDRAGILFPVPSTFPDTPVFKLGSTVVIPIQARCVGYTSGCPWVDPGVISGDDPLRGVNSEVSILALSDSTEGWMGGDLTVQSATLGTGNIPVATSTFGPTALTPDANGWIAATLSSSQVFSGTALTPEVDGALVSFDAGLATGQTLPSGRTRTVYIPLRAGEIGPGVSPLPPGLSRKTSVAFCLRADLAADTVYGEPRNSFWRLSSDPKNRLLATLVNGYEPYEAALNRYPVRSGTAVIGFSPLVRIYDALLTAVYRRLDNIWVAASSDDQLTSLGDETVLFNQSGGNVTFEYDGATGCQYYVMSLRDDGLSWQTTPTPSTDPSRLPQVAVLRRRDARGGSLPFAKSDTAAVSGQVWENVIFVDAISNGTMTIQVLPQGTVVLTCGTSLYTSADNGSNFYDQSGALVQSLTNQTSAQLASGANGGTENP